VCDAFLQPVPAPVVTRKTTPALAYTRAADALDEANNRIAIGGMCVSDERTQYAGPKETPR
jgi:hypothetical protein